jgi:penicillin-binding protein 2
MSNESWLSWFLRGALVLFLLILMGKLTEVQIIKGGYYRSLAESNRIRRIPIPAPRGRILSADGTALADNVAVKERVLMDGGGVRLSRDLTNAEPDEIVTNYKRVYPLAEKFAHGTGYLSVVSEKGVGTVDPRCPEKGVLQSGSLVGVSGLEEQYDCLLRGNVGEELVEVDTLGKKTRILAIKNPVPGSDLKTSIDYRLQEYLGETFSLPPPQTPANKNASTKKGAAIVTDEKGRILAFYSSPTYDPNHLIENNYNSQPEGSATVSALLKSPDLPFFNRVIGGSFHPGSVYKPLVALAALEEGSINKNYQYTDTGSITVNNFTYRNWYFTEYGRTEGSIDLRRAIARSTDTFFYKMGELTGPGIIAKWSETFGLNKLTGIDLPGEKTGLIPTPEWKKEIKKESWFLGDTYNISIGQGDVAVSPVELNTYITALAAYGKLCRPMFWVNQNPVCTQIALNNSNVDFIKEGMLAACNNGGTAYTFFDFTEKHPGIDVACKTGTAEVATNGEPHAWFTFFAPSKNPKIVATILYEEGGQGSSVAGPLARKIADYYFERE